MTGVTHQVSDDEIKTLSSLAIEVLWCCSVATGSLCGAMACILFGPSLNIVFWILVVVMALALCAGGLVVATIQEMLRVIRNVQVPEDRQKAGLI